MIRNSFVLLEKISYAKERGIWSHGITDWNAFLSTRHIKGISRRIKIHYDKELICASKALLENNSAYFIDKLIGMDTWRLFEEFRDKVLYLDIETSGVTRHDDITMMGIYDGFEPKVIFRSNFDHNQLKEYLSRFKLIVTYNGSSFDIPFLKKRYPKLLPLVPHVDLRPLCANLGLVGGLKEVEKNLGIKRSTIVEKFSNGDPYRLYRMYRATRDEFYLNLLIEYNEEDVTNLKRISETIIPRLSKGLLIPASSRL